MIASKATQRRLDEAEALRDKVFASIALPGIDWSGLSARKIGWIVETLRKLAELTGGAVDEVPFETRYADTPGVTWSTPNGLILEAIQIWADEQCSEACVALEKMEPSDPDERDERTILLLQFYARSAEFDRAVSLLSGAPVKGLALAMKVEAYINSGPTEETPDSLAAQGLNADAELLAMARAVLVA